MVVETVVVARPDHPNKCVTINKSDMTSGDKIYKKPAVKK